MRYQLKDNKLYVEIAIPADLKAVVSEDNLSSSGKTIGFIQMRPTGNSLSNRVTNHCKFKSTLISQLKILKRCELISTK